MGPPARMNPRYHPPGLEARSGNPFNLVALQPRSQRLLRLLLACHASRQLVPTLVASTIIPSNCGAAALAWFLRILVQCSLLTDHLCWLFDGRDFLKVERLPKLGRRISTCYQGKGWMASLACSMNTSLRSAPSGRGTD